MGWNDHFDPSDYDPADPDSMRALANRALATSASKVPDPTPDAEKGECWDCGRMAKLGGKGLCAPCYIADNY